MNQGLRVAATVFEQLASQFAAAFGAGLWIHDFQKSLLGKDAVTDGEVGVVEMRCNGRENLLQRPGAMHVRVIVACQGQLLKAGQAVRNARQTAGQIGKLHGQFTQPEGLELRMVGVDRPFVTAGGDQRLGTIAPRILGAAGQVLPRARLTPGARSMWQDHWNGMTMCGPVPGQTGKPTESVSKSK